MVTVRPADSSTLQVVPYRPERKAEWNALVARSRNGTFLIERDYMDYHADRFRDCSYVVLKRMNVEAVIPGNQDGATFFSHQGLSYGGLISTDGISASDTLRVFELLGEQLVRQGFKSVVYKPVPRLYHKLPAEEDLYALFRMGAKLTCRQLSSAVLQANKVQFTESRMSGIRKARRGAVQVIESDRYPEFWRLLEHVLLSKHGTRPVHSLAEIRNLSTSFPGNIRLHTAVSNGVVVAGAVMYLTDRVAHVQYIATNEEGRMCGALDLLFECLINQEYESKPIFDFGTSTTDGGRVLNEGLVFQKEGFGGRGLVYDTYEYHL